jgi:hypothetical protein
MDKHVLAASVGLNKSVALCRVKPLHCTYRHVNSPIDSKTRKDGDEIRRKKGPASVALAREIRCLAASATALAQYSRNDRLIPFWGAGILDFIGLVEAALDQFGQYHHTITAKVV